MTFKKLAVAVGISVAFGLGAAGNARADAMANALIDISHFILTGPAGVPLNITDFSQISFQDTLVNNALLNPGGFDAQFAATNTFSAATDAPMACVGAPCAGIPQNLFVPATVPPTSTYARSDSLLTGVPITGVPFALGVRAGTIAETSINTNASGGSSSDILLTSSFQFVLAHDVAEADIHFDATTFLRAWTAALSLPGTTAGAGFKWELTLVDGIGGATLIDWIPNGNIATGTQSGLRLRARVATSSRTQARRSTSRPRRPRTAPEVLPRSRISCFSPTIRTASRSIITCRRRRPRSSLPPSRARSHCSASVSRASASCAGAGAEPSDDGPIQRMRPFGAVFFTRARSPTRWRAPRARTTTRSRSTSDAMVFVTDRRRAARRETAGAERGRSSCRRVAQAAGRGIRAT